MTARGTNPNFMNGIPELLIGTEYFLELAFKLTESIGFVGVSARIR
jgi:hypothetical protein